MEKLLLHITYTAKQGMREQFVNEIISSGVLDKIHHEDGCYMYEYYFSAQNENDVLLVEKWESEEKQQIHLTQPHMKVLNEIKDKYIIDVKLEKIYFHK